jgi:hypothetical protein
MFYSSESGKKLRFFFPLSLCSIPSSFLLLCVFHTLFFSCWIMITQLLLIEQQQKVISGSVYLGEK